VATEINVVALTFDFLIPSQSLNFGQSQLILRQDKKSKWVATISGSCFHLQRCTLDISSNFNKRILSSVSLVLFRHLHRHLAYSIVLWHVKAGGIIVKRPAVR